jgi:hypothetical protein
LDLYEDLIDKAEDAHAFSSSPHSRVKGLHRTSWHAVPLLKNSGYEEFDHPIRPTFRKPWTSGLLSRIIKYIATDAEKYQNNCRNMQGPQTSTISSEPGNTQVLH